MSVLKTTEEEPAESAVEPSPNAEHNERESSHVYRGFASRAIHVGQDPDPQTGAVIPPIHATSTFVQFEFGEPGEYIYSRSANPTRTALERNLAALEGSKHAIAFGSGMAATDAVLRFVLPGQRVLASFDMYGGTYRLFEQVLRDFGIGFDYVDTSDVATVKAAMTSETRMIFVETPTNPLMTIADLEAIAGVSKARGARLVVDNTFMSPYLQNPLEFGVDIVVHSTTKYINGHSDSIGGVAMTNSDADAERLLFIAKSVGAALSPFEAWLIQRGVKTLAVRMDRAESTAGLVAAMLDGHDKVERVYYPGLPDHPQHDLARRQMRGFGSMVSFDLPDRAAVKSMLDAVQLCTLAESLGGVETLISHPPSMTHASIPLEERLARGVNDGLVRISVGIEEAEDILDDLGQALDQV